jgi:L-histidine Nalpha-methyltransferase
MRPLTDTPRVRIRSCLSEQDERTLADDVRRGLSKPFKELPPKHFYDARGSELFERICELPEYYPTRVERQILAQRADEIAVHTGAVELVELGSGSAEKARILLDAMGQTGTLRRYVPLDVSEQALHQAAAQLVAEYDGLRVDGVVGDFERHLDSIPARDGGPRIVALLGGTLGNFTPAPRRRLLGEIRRLLEPEDRLLLGADLVKDPGTLEAAYDDSAGVTAEFNRNLLHVINRDLDADFDTEQFEHVAFFDPVQEWVEMRLRARSPQSVHIRRLELRVEFRAGEELRTEISAKFTRERLDGDFKAAGLSLERWYTDADGRFALLLVAPDRPCPWEGSR